MGRLIMIRLQCFSRSAKEGRESSLHAPLGTKDAGSASDDKDFRITLINQPRAFFPRKSLVVESLLPNLTAVYEIGLWRERVGVVS